MFKVKKIEVKNASNLDIDKIKTDSGIVEGRNIFLQRYFKGIFKLKENARIQDVKIYPVFPDKIEIYVEERNENYQISDENGYYIIDKNGYILRIDPYVIYKEGGIYLDTDVLVLDNFDRFLENRAFWQFA